MHLHRATPSVHVLDVVLVALLEFGVGDILAEPKAEVLDVFLDAESKRLCVCVSTIKQKGKELKREKGRKKENFHEESELLPGEVSQMVVLNHRRVWNTHAEGEQCTPFLIHLCGICVFVWLID